MINVKTDFGLITITKNSIAKIISEVVESLDGRVVLTNHKGKPLGIAGKIGMIDESNMMEINIVNNSIDIKFYVMTKFGYSICNITNNLIETIRSEMITITGVCPNSISIVITGMLSKNEKIIKRNIEVKK